MNKKEILDNYSAKTENILKTLHQFSEKQFFQNPAPEVWSAAQNVEHITLVTLPMVGLFGKPDIMAERWGYAGIEPLKSYDEIAGAYIKATGGKGKSPAPFVPHTTEATMHAQLDKFILVNDKFVSAYAALSDEQVNMHQIPHPYIGNLRVTEFMQFMAFHLDHHHKHITNALKAV